MASKFDIFLEKLGRAEALSYEEEYSLLEAVASGDMIARNRIAESRLRQVASLVWEAGEFSEHILAGNAGVLKAIDAFTKNPGKWRDFDECAESFIRKEITE